MSGDRSYASVPERITWTSGFHNGTDKIVLGALSMFANFETGKGARVRVNKLAARAELEPRTVQRSLHRLEAGGWIVAVRRQHKRATAWDINVDRLATTWVAMKAVGGVMPSFPQGAQALNDKSDVQLDDKMIAQLNDKTDVQGARLNVKTVVQEPILERQNCRADPQYVPDQIPREDLIPSAPALRAGLFDADDGKIPETHAPESTTPTTDIRADGRDRARGPDEIPGRPDDADGRRGAEHRTTPGAGVPLRQGRDLPGSESVDRPGPPVEPHQQTFGPIDVSPPAPRSPQWGQLADALRAGLKRKSG